VQVTTRRGRLSSTACWAASATGPALRRHEAEETRTGGGGHDRERRIAKRSLSGHDFIEELLVDAEIVVIVNVP
jgi:hypothetical protein